MSHFKQFLIILMFCNVLLGCSDVNIKQHDQVLSATDSQNMAVIECMLPNQVTRLSENIIYYSPARPIKTSLPNCEISGGQII